MCVCVLPELFLSPSFWARSKTYGSSRLGTTDRTNTSFSWPVTWAFNKELRGVQVEVGRDKNRCCLRSLAESICPNSWSPQYATILWPLIYGENDRLKHGMEWGFEIFRQNQVDSKCEETISQSHILSKICISKCAWFSLLFFWAI